MTIYDEAIQTYCGRKVMLNNFLVEQVDNPRSPGRAKRRARMGHRQHRITQPSRSVLAMADGTLVMHPETWNTLRTTLLEPRKDQGSLPTTEPTHAPNRPTASPLAWMNAIRPEHSLVVACLS